MIRIGQGIDVHPFDEERALVLGGVRISDRGGLAGHSDADAVLHAVADAILGSIGAGDIGTHFPSSDERWRDVGSSRFVREALAMLQKVGVHLVNVDVTIIAQKPRIAPHRDEIIQSVASILDLPRSHVSIKATTTDGLGFIGRAEGLCAMAVVLVESGDGSPEK